MVGVDHEMSCLQHVSEVFYSLVNSQQFFVIGPIFLLRRTHFLRQKGYRLPCVFSPLLQHCSRGRARGVGYQGNGDGPVRVSEHGGGRQTDFALVEGSVEFWFPVDGLGNNVFGPARRVCRDACVVAA